MKAKRFTDSLASRIFFSLLFLPLMMQVVYVILANPRAASISQVSLKGAIRYPEKKCAKFNTYPELILAGYQYTTASCDSKDFDFLYLLIVIYLGIINIGQCVMTFQVRNVTMRGLDLGKCNSCGNDVGYHYSIIHIHSVILNFI